MIELDKVKEYHRQAVASVKNKSEHAIADLILLRAVYEGRSECFIPSIEGLFFIYAGDAVERGFENAENIARTIGGSFTIPYEAELKLLDLWTLDMESRTKQIRELGLKKVPLESTSQVDTSFEYNPELDPKNVSLYRSLISSASKYKRPLI